MRSRIAEEAERELVEATQRLTPEQRVHAFLRHSRLLMQLHEAGKRALSAKNGPEHENDRTG